MEKPTGEPQPESYHIVSHYSDITGILQGFTVEDPGGKPVSKWLQYIDEIHKQYPGVSIKELEKAKVSYTQYRAVFVLERVSFTPDKLVGRPAAQSPETPQRLARYGVAKEDYGKVIEMDRKYSQEELRKMCREKGLPTSGDKKKLISRLLEEEYGK